MLAAALFLATFAGLGQSATPVLLGTPTAAAEATPAPEITIVQAISDDGRWLLFASTSERLVPTDHNTAADVFLLDRSTGDLSLVSADAAGDAGSGTSMAGGMSADAPRGVPEPRLEPRQP